MSFESDFFHSLNQHHFNFEELALRLFRFQAERVEVYQKFLNLLGVNANEVNSLTQIPFLPVSFFKTHRILLKEANDIFQFTSSTTSGGLPSLHYVPDLNVYEWSFTKAFQQFYQPYQNYCILGLLPNYLERGGSSLVYMVDKMIKESKYPQSNFFLNDFEALNKQLQQNEANQIPTLLIGVTYALLDFAKLFPSPLKNTIVMETGGMKGRRKEMLRSAVHAELKQAFGLTSIHSEYGMTELLSQAYSKGEGVFETPDWLRLFAAEIHDPRTLLPFGKAGSINCIDLANIYSCAFIATDDLGVVNENNTFEIIGRKDHSDIRGCGLMYLS